MSIQTMDDQKKVYVKNKQFLLKKNRPKKWSNSANIFALQDIPQSGPIIYG